MKQKRRVFDQAFKLAAVKLIVKRRIGAFKKVPGLLKGKQCIRLQYLKEHKCKLNIKKACQTLQISRSGFYEFCNRKPSERPLENEIYSDKIKSIFEEHKSRYGSARITKVLKNEGLSISRPRVARLMNGMNLFARGTNYHYNNYHKNHSDYQPNLLNQVFRSPQKGRIWPSDITYIQTKQGTLYLAVFLDVYSRKIVGWSMDTTMKEKLVTDAFLQAYPYDNAMMESFYRTLKRELLPNEKYESPAEAKLEIFQYIELYYNTKQMHFSLGFLSPAQFENI